MADKRKYADRREELIKAVAKRRRKVKLLSVQYKGGKCQICGYDKCTAGFSFHHTDPSKKEYTISQIRFTTFDERTKQELDKCILLCRNCHAEEHYKQNH